MKNKSDSILKALKSSQPLHIKLESQYHKEVEIPLLEVKKKKLEEIRNLYKEPIDYKDII